MGQSTRKGVTLGVSDKIGTELSPVLVLAKVPDLRSQLIHSAFVGWDALDVLAITPAIVRRVCRWFSFLQRISRVADFDIFGIGNDEVTASCLHVVSKSDTDGTSPFESW